MKMRNKVKKLWHWSRQKEGGGRLGEGRVRGREAGERVGRGVVVGKVATVRNIG